MAARAGPRGAGRQGREGRGQGSGERRPPARPGPGPLRPSAKPFSQGDKASDKARVEALALELDTLQDLLYADKRYKLLVILQGTDTSGKDGTVRGVFGRMSALGVHAVGWKAPTDTERAHDYLWRIHQQVPGAGELTVFNRSHYEDVLVPVVNGWITPEQHRQRLAHINDFERLLTETGTVVVKFMLHISRDEQRKRLQERLDDPAKHWKFDLGDIAARKQWDDYQRAYATLLAATHTPWALDHRACRLQDPPQPHDRHRAARGAGPARPALPRRRSRAGGHPDGMSRATARRPALEKRRCGPPRRLCMRRITR